MKLTRGTSCVLCQQRKVRCDKRKPCSNCVKSGAECRVIPPAPPRRRRRRIQEKELIERLQRYETILTEHGIHFDPIGHDLPSDLPPMDDVDELEDEFESLKASPDVAGTSRSAASRKERPRRSCLSLHKEFRASEQLLRDSSDDEVDGSTLHRAFDNMFGNQGGFPFVTDGRVESVTDAHPSTIQIFQLWQLYIDNVNSLLKITHVPTVQGQIVDATSCLHRMPKNIEALMFAIYSMAVTSLDDAEVLERFGELKRDLLGRYFSALQQALLNAGFLRNDDFTSLQAYTLYLLALRWYVDPRHVFCLIGIAVRIAQRMGLHRDPAGFGLSPFEMEQRRRLWWTIVGYDRRIGEITGSTVTALSGGGDCKMPLNVNDADLHVEGTDSPLPHSGPTEMLFALSRVEMAMAVAGNGSRDCHRVNKTKTAKVGQGSSQTSAARSPGATIRIAGQESPSYTLDGFCAHVEGKYLPQCDPKIPLHLFTLTMTRQTLCKMRIVDFLVRIHNAEAMPLEDAERDSLFELSTQMIEHDNTVQSSESLRPFRWYSMHYFPFPAYMFLVQELRTRVTGMPVERAWSTMASNHELRGLLSHSRSPMHMAFGNLFLKAWDAHQAAMQATGEEVNPPQFIGLLRQRSEVRRKARTENLQDPDLEATPVDLPSAQSRGKTTATGSWGRVEAMTPSSADASVTGTAPAPPAPHGPTQLHGNGMDWSYLSPEYDDVGALQAFGNFGAFGLPMEEDRGGRQGAGSMFDN
ncbi:hypothetical protein RJ55_08063 [Drechmeria coniospora]|nr:hypothetical protein RJ55_08063 [Drechmeria coniospora]